MSTATVPEQNLSAFNAFCAAGLWPGLGRTLAEALPDAQILGPADVTLERLSLLPKVGLSRAGRLLSGFIAAAPLLELVQLLQPAGLEPRLASRLIDTLGPPAPRLLREDPWRVLTIAGVSPNEADRLARAAIPGVARDDSRRSRALVGYALRLQAQEGHTLCERSEVAHQLATWGVTEQEAAVQDALAEKLIVAYPDETLAATRYGEAERAIAEEIARLLRSASPITVTKAGMKASAQLDDTQASAVRHLLAGGMSVLTGGPGTGKSRTVSAVVAAAESAGKSVALAAPTGRAAKRLEELCEAPATTLHRLLGAQPRNEGDGLSFNAGFQHDRNDPLEADIVVVDESSMLDVLLAAALLEACADGTHVLFVGDAAQLPSIGPGRVLGDLIDSGRLPVTELTKLYRQAEGGAIAQLATSVRGGELPAATDDGTHEVVVVPAPNSAQAARRVMQLVTDSIPRALGIAAEQVQVVTPIHGGPAGTQALNAVLKQQLNPGTGRRRFDPGDRVVATANHPEAEPCGYANGEVGVVTDVTSEGALTVQFASGAARVKGKALADLLHGWAITVHRAQGSEFPAVVVVLPVEAGRMLSRPLVYTAMTRAQRHLSIVHSAGGAVAHAVRRVGATPRKTRLAHQLRTRVGADSTSDAGDAGS